MNIKKERRIEVNRWVINARWFYILGILAFAFLSATTSGVKINFFNFGGLSSSILLINLLFLLALRKSKENISSLRLKVISYLQIFVELIIITVAVYITGGENSVFFAFYLLPVLSSVFLLSMRASIFIAIISISFFVLVVDFETRGILPNVEYGDSSFVVKIFSILFLFLFIGTFSSFLKRLLLSREELLQEKTDAFVRESEYRENEWKQLDKTTKLLVKRDHELTSSNKELETKMKDLKRSEKSMLSAFSDLKHERKKTEEERNKTMAIISNFVDPIIVLDKEDKIELFNPIAIDLFGFDESDLNKKVSNKNNYSMENFKEIINQEFKVKKDKDLDSGNHVEEITITINKQESIYKAITAPVLDNEKKNIGNMKVFYNMTREKMLDRLKSEFISIAAHQLRTPLAAIKWVIQMVLSGDTGPLNDEQKEVLTKGYQSNERIIELVNDMLNVSRIEEGRFGYSFEEGDIIKEIDIVVDTLEPRIKEKSIKLTITKPNKIPKVYMDSKKILLVMQNLIENAVKYTQESGKIDIIIEVGDKFLKVHVKDNGVGIPKKDQEKLFSKFFRATNVIRMQTEGSGLGLFMVKNIIKKHDGDIIFKSEEGMGTEFIFTLPIDKNS
ncbi:GHKL domain-containing protein [Candidatus Parcubacteria bacterium]|nr:GHKL domain-containing protein [Candidatus Parcubacteria bacterium]